MTPPSSVANKNKKGKWVLFPFQEQSYKSMFLKGNIAFLTFLSTDEGGGYTASETDIVVTAYFLFSVF